MSLLFWRKRSLPPPRSLPWPLKSVSSARTSLGYDAHGRMTMDIHHDLLKAVTPEMIAWWFANIGGHMTVDGQTMSRYHAWHPRDHIHWQLVSAGLDGRTTVGSKFQIVEMFGRDPRYYVDVIDMVTRLDASGIALSGHMLGLQVSHLNHDFIAVSGGTQYVSRLTIGVDLPALAVLINPLLHRFVFDEAMGRAWIRHNIEEVGLLEHLLPLLANEIAGPQAPVATAAGAG